MWLACHSTYEQGRVERHMKSKEVCGLVRLFCKLCRGCVFRLARLCQHAALGTGCIYTATTQLPLVMACLALHRHLLTLPSTPNFWQACRAPATYKALLGACYILAKSSS